MLEDGTNQPVELNEKITKTENKGSSYFQPITKGDLRALIDLHKKGDFFPTSTLSCEDITRRDIVEYAHTRQMAYCIDQLALKIKDFDFSIEPVDKLRQEMRDVILDVDTIPDGLSLTPSQRQAVENGMDLFIDDLVAFKRNVLVEGGEDYVKSHLGVRFQGLSEGSYTIDSKSYPGAVVVRIHSKSDYAKFAPERTKGVYARDLGEGQLKGRVLVLNGQSSDEEVEFHEYLHYLNRKLMHLETMPTKEDKADIARAESRIDIEEKISDLEEKRYTSNNGQNAEIEEKIRMLKEQNRIVGEQAYASLVTYKNPLLKTAFDRTRDEILAYTLGTPSITSNKINRAANEDNSESGGYSDFETGVLGKELISELQNYSDGRWFLSEFKSLQSVIIAASKKGVGLGEIGLIVLGSRNLEQASKFVYLHLQQAPTMLTNMTEKPIGVVQDLGLTSLAA